MFIRTQINPMNGIDNGIQNIINNCGPSSSSSSSTHFGPNMANCFLQQFPQQIIPPQLFPSPHPTNWPVNLNSLLLLNFSSNAILNAAKQRNEFPQLLAASIPTFIPPSNLLIEQQKQRDNLLKAMAMDNGREEDFVLADDEKKPTTMKKKSADKYKYYKLEELHPDNITLHDVLDELNRLLALIKLERHYILTMVPPITKQFEPGGVAADYVVSLETFKVSVHLLEICRKEVDIRIMNVFWPLFHQLYLHLDLCHLDEAVGHFYSMEGLLDPGAGAHQIKKMQDSFPDFYTKFAAASQFITREPYRSVDDQYRAKCRHLCFFLILHPKRFVKQLTMEAMECAKDNGDAIYNLAQLFRLVPSLILRQVSVDSVDCDEGQTEELAVALVRRIYKYEMTSKNRQWKKQLLEEFVNYLANDFEITEGGQFMVHPPIIAGDKFEGVFDDDEIEQPPPPPQMMAYGYGQPPYQKYFNNGQHHKYRQQWPIY